MALSTAIDRDAIIKDVYLGAGVKAKTLIPPTMWSFDDKIVDIPYDPGKAKAMLAAAGWGVASLVLSPCHLASIPPPGRIHLLLYCIKLLNYLNRNENVIVLELKDALGVPDQNICIKAEMFKRILSGLRFSRPVRVASGE